MPRQQPIYVSRNEYDDLQREGFTKSGPRFNSCASSRQSSIGDVERRSSFSKRQRTGMLAEVRDDTNSLGGAVAVAGVVVGVAVGVGALFYGGYKAYKYFFPSKKNDSSQAPTSGNLVIRNAEEPKFVPLSRDKTDDDNKHQEKVIKDDTEDFRNSIGKDNEEKEIPTLKLHQDDVNSMGLETPTLKLRQEDINSMETKIPTLKLRQEAIASTGTEIQTLKLRQAGETVKGENLIDQTDENCKEDSEKSQQLSEPSSDPSSENAQAVEDNNTVEDIKEDSEDANKNSKEGSDESQLVDQPPTDSSPENAQINMNNFDEEVENINREVAGSCIKGTSNRAFKHG